MYPNYYKNGESLIIIDLNTICFTSAEIFLFHYTDNKNYDILLLDIEMGKMDLEIVALNAF